MCTNSHYCAIARQTKAVAAFTVLVAFNVTSMLIPHLGVGRVDQHQAQHYDAHPERVPYLKFIALHACRRENAQKPCVRIKVLIYVFFIV